MEPRSVAGTVWHNHKAPPLCGVPGGAVYGQRGFDLGRRPKGSPGDAGSTPALSTPTFGDAPAEG